MWHSPELLLEIFLQTIVQIFCQSCWRIFDIKPRNWLDCWALGSIVRPAHFSTIQSGLHIVGSCRVYICEQYNLGFTVSTVQSAHCEGCTLVMNNTIWAHCSTQCTLVNNLPARGNSFWVLLLARPGLFHPSDSHKAQGTNVTGNCQRPRQWRKSIT